MTRDTLTARKRAHHPARYVKKDARTRIYRALYGAPSRPDPAGHPELNDTRKLQDFDYQRVKQMLEDNLLLAQFSEAQEAALRRRLAVLREAQS